MKILPEDWLQVFALETPLVELVVRGAVLYLGILVLFRIMPRRSGGELATMDLIFVLLIAQAAANAFGEFSSVADSFVIIVVTMLGNYTVNALSSRVPLLERLVSAPPLKVIENGRFLWRNMRREFVTEEELMARLRRHGLSRVEDVAAAYVESEGQISVVPRKT